MMTNRFLVRVILAVCALLFAAHSTRAQGTDKTQASAESYVDRGIQSALKGDYKTAIADFTEALKLDPDMAAAYSLRGRALYASVSDVIKTGNNFSEITTLIPDGEAAPEQIPVFNKAIADFTQALRLTQDNDAIYRERGNACRDKGDYDRAIADYNRAIRLNPDSAAAYNNRGITYYYYKGDKDWAIADFTEAIRIDPDEADAYNSRGSVYSSKGEYDRAIADFTEAIQIDPNFAQAYFNRGNAYSHKDDYKRNIADYTEAIRIDPNFVNAYGNRGIAYANKGDFDKAVADFEAAVRIAPNNARMKEFLELAREERGY